MGSDQTQGQRPNPDPEHSPDHLGIMRFSEPGPFSTFPSFDRAITLVEGERMDLEIDGVVHTLGLHESLSFDGASQTSCSLPGGQTRDLNVMTRAHRYSAAVAIRDLSETRPVAVSECEVLVLLTGSAAVVRIEDHHHGATPVQQGFDELENRGALSS